MIVVVKVVVEEVVLVEFIKVYLNLTLPYLTTLLQIQLGLPFLPFPFHPPPFILPLSSSPFHPPPFILPSPLFLR